MDRYVRLGRRLRWKLNGETLPVSTIFLTSSRVNGPSPQEASYQSAVNKKAQKSSMLTRSSWMRRILGPHSGAFRRWLHACASVRCSSVPLRQASKLTDGAKNRVASMAMPPKKEGTIKIERMCYFIIHYHTFTKQSYPHHFASPRRSFAVRSRSSIHSIVRTMCYYHDNYGQNRPLPHLCRP